MSEEQPTPGLPIAESGQVAFSLNVEELYGFDSAGAAPKELLIEKVHWANHAFVFVLGQDVVIDFVQAPSIPSAGKQLIPAVRIAMNRVTAKRIADIIIQNIEQARQQALAARQAKKTPVTESTKPS